MRTKFTSRLWASGLALGIAAGATVPSNAQTTTVATPATVPTAMLIATPVADTSEPALTLEAAIDVALANHGNVSAARQSLAASQSRITAARSGLYPQANVSVGTDIGRSTTVSGTGVSSGSANSSSYTTSTQTNFGLSQNIFDGGRARAQVRQAQSNTVSAGAGIGIARQNLASTVANNFYEQLRQERLVQQRGQQVGLALAQLAQIEAQIEAGTVARVDAQSVRVTLSQARFDLTSARNALTTAQTNLRNALGLQRGPALRLSEGTDVAALSASFAPLSAEETATALASPALVAAPNEEATVAGDTPMPAAPTPAPISLPVLAGLEQYIEQAQRLRPDLLQARAAVQRSEAAVSIAKADQLPQVSVSAGYNLQNLTNSGRGPTAGLSLSLPLFDAGVRKADVKASQAELAAVRLQLGQLDKDVDADVEAAYVNVSGSVERISNAQDLVVSARANLEAATERYRAGVGIVLDVVNAQTQFAQAQTSATTAIYDYQVALANLARATGRFAPESPEAAENAGTNTQR